MLKLYPSTSSKSIHNLYTMVKASHVASDCQYRHPIRAPRKHVESVDVCVVPVPGDKSSEHMFNGVQPPCGSQRLLSKFETTEPPFGTAAGILYTCAGIPLRVGFNHICKYTLGTFRRVLETLMTMGQKLEFATLVWTNMHIGICLTTNFGYGLPGLAFTGSFALLAPLPYRLPRQQESTGRNKHS